MNDERRITDESLDPANISPEEIAEIRSQLRDLHDQMNEVHTTKQNAEQQFHELRVQAGALGARLMGFPDLNQTAEPEIAGRIGGDTSDE